MIISRQNALKPLIASKNGLHLTAYLNNHRDLSGLVRQVREVVAEADEWLKPALSEDERQKFLEPVRKLAHDPEMLARMSGNVGIFRNSTFFRVLNIPSPVHRSCVVATSFHVKPLLRWLQDDREFLLLGVENRGAFLYQGSRQAFNLVGSIPLDGNVRQSADWIDQWLSGLTKGSKPPLYLAGAPRSVQPLIAALHYRRLVRKPIAFSFSSDNVSHPRSKIRQALQRESELSLEKTLREFQAAEATNRAKKNIFQIAKAVVQGRVRKLVITDDILIFGRIDETSGGLALHPVHLDHEDDCLLDDLAQMVLSHGGEVVIARRDQIPKGRPILAILTDGAIELSRQEDMEYEDLQERTA